MKKYRINVQEVVAYNHSIGFEYFGCLDEVDTMLDDIENESRSFDEVKYLLSKKGCQKIEVCKDGSGDVEIEIDDMEELD